jgi:hypothetical protein
MAELWPGSGGNGVAATTEPLAISRVAPAKKSAAKENEVLRVGIYDPSLLNGPTTVVRSSAEGEIVAPPGT